MIQYLFKQLEIAASENVFAVLVDKSGEYTIVYLGSGGVSSAFMRPSGKNSFIVFVYRLNAHGLREEIGTIKGIDKNKIPGISEIGGEIAAILNKAETKDIIDIAHLKNNVNYM